MNSRVLIALFCFICTGACAQVTSNDIIRKYSDFRKVLPASRLHLVFNQDKFAPGDTIFFKGYFLNDNNQPIAGRQLIDVSLVGTGNSVVAHFLFSITNGIGASQVVLPETLKPGIYMLTAYSTWMKNFEIPPVFSKEITVVGEKHVVENSKDMQPGSITVSDNQVKVMIAENSLVRYQRLKLIITNKGQITFIRSFVPALKGSVSIQLDKDALRPGVNVLNVVDPQWLTVAATSIYKQDEHPVSVVIESDDLLAIRKNSTIKVNIRDAASNQPVKGEFSVSILNPVAIDTLMSPAQRFALTATLVEPWRQIVAGRKTPRYSYKTDLARTGRVFLPDGSPATSGTRVVFYFQENDITTQAFTSEGGRIRLSVPDISHDDEVFYLAEYTGDEIPGIIVKWDNVVIQPQSPPSSVELDEVDAYGVFATNKRLVDKAFDFNETHAVDIAKDIERNHSELENKIIGGPDINIVIDKYVLFSSMTELIREIVPALHLRKVKGVTVASLSLQEGISTSEPLYVIDGVVTKNTQYFLSLTPADLVAVRLVTNPQKLTSLGLLGKSGLVVVESKTGKLKPLKDPSREVESISKAINFKGASNSDVRRPDFRSTIYWNPIVRTDSEGKAVIEFQCSDDIGPVKVRIHGMTLDGRPFSGETTLMQHFPGK